MLFPRCLFNVLLPDGVMWAGSRAEGTLELTVPEDIPRSERIELNYTVEAWAGYGSGRSRNVVRQTIFSAPLEIRVPERVLHKGVHRHPFAIDVPPWMPPGYAGNDCGIRHRLNARLDVDWAFDPKETLEPPLGMSPRSGFRTPLTIRSPAGFHDSIVVEVALPSTAIAVGEPLAGQLALRARRDARFDAIVLSIQQVARITMGRGDSRIQPVTGVRIPASALRAGEAVPFLFPADLRIFPTFRNPFIDNDVHLSVRIEISWARDPEFLIPLLVLPAGSQLSGDASYAPVGGERVRLAARAMAHEAGLSEGRPPVLVEGNLGPVRLRVLDAPREGRIGVEAECVFPDVDFGTSFRPRHMLDRFRDSPLLTGTLADRFLLRVQRNEHAPPLDDAILVRFYEQVLSGMETADELRLSDQHLAAHFTLVDDDGERMKDLALFLRQKAEHIAEAIRTLPFPQEFLSSAGVWQAVATEQGGFLVPHGPAIDGLTFGARLFDGTERVIGVAIRTVWTKDGQETRAEIDLRGATIPDAAQAVLANGDDELALAIRNTFPVVQVEGGSALLERPGFLPDPRSTFPAIDSFLSFLLAARGEHKALAPYR